MGWDNDPFTVWHGTVGPYADLIVHSGPDLTKCSDETDFGRGFYVTRIREHAVLHANERYDELFDQYNRRHTSRVPFNPMCAAVIEFTINLNDLSRLITLAFVQPTPKWLEFVQHCRQPSCNHDPASGDYYDVVYGPVFDAGTDSVIPGREQISFHRSGSRSLLTPVGGTSSITRGRPYLS